MPRGSLSTNISGPWLPSMPQHERRSLITPESSTSRRHPWGDRRSRSFPGIDRWMGMNVGPASPIPRTETLLLPACGATEPTALPKRHHTAHPAGIRMMIPLRRQPDRRTEHPPTQYRDNQKEALGNRTGYYCRNLPVARSPLQPIDNHVTTRVPLRIHEGLRDTTIERLV